MMDQHSHQKLGVIGGGQLGLYLMAAAHRMGISPEVFSDHPDAPASRLYSQSRVGSLKSDHDLREFFKFTQTVVFENEFVDCEQLRRNAQNHRLRFFPSLDVLSILQDKLQQKQIFKQLEIPTSLYEVIDLEGLGESLDRVSTRLGGSSVLKWARMGYDGRGVYFYQSGQNQDPKLDRFLRDAKSYGSPLFMESRIEFKRELAMISVRSIHGEFKSYPLVISEQETGICSRVYGPAVAHGVSDDLEVQAKVYAQKLAEKLGVVGVFAMEFFETADGRLLVNEIAPRVHNSGHYTQTACATDQFENHWRAVLGWPLGDTSPRSSFAMLNLLGPMNLPVNPAAEYERIPKDLPSNLHLFWYGKKEIRLRRKLGHINGLSKDSELNILLAELDQVRQSWVKQLSAQSGDHL